MNGRRSPSRIRAERAVQARIAEEQRQVAAKARRRRRVLALVASAILLMSGGLAVTDFIFVHHMFGAGQLNEANELSFFVTKDSAQAFPNSQFGAVSVDVQDAPNHEYYRVNISEEIIVRHDDFRPQRDKLRLVAEGPVIGRFQSLIGKAHIRKLHLHRSGMTTKRVGKRWQATINYSAPNQEQDVGMPFGMIAKSVHYVGHNRKLSFAIPYRYFTADESISHRLPGTPNMVIGHNDGDGTYFGAISLEVRPPRVEQTSLSDALEHFGWDPDLVPDRVVYSEEKLQAGIQTCPCIGGRAASPGVTTPREGVLFEAIPYAESGDFEFTTQNTTIYVLVLVAKTLAGTVLLGLIVDYLRRKVRRDSSS